MPNSTVVDLSHHNPVSSFSSLRMAGTLGVIYKASEGSNYADPTYQQRRKEARDAGLLFGSYHFLRPGDMKAQALWYVACAQAAADELLCSDHEDTGVSLDDLKTFLKAVEDSLGRKPVIYSGHVLKEQVGSNPDPVMAEYRLWLAQYSDSPTWPTAIWPKPWLWQWTDQGFRPGVQGNVDCDHFDGSEDDLRASWAGAVVAPPAPPVAPDAGVYILPPGTKITIGSGGATVTLPSGVTLRDG